MNERLKQLLEDATEIHDDWKTGTSHRIVNHKIFAELIVRECIAKVEMRKKFAIEDEHIVDHAFDLLVYDLESHFGVEE